MVKENSKKSPFRYLLLRYFAHGLLFSVLGLIIGIVLGIILLGSIFFAALIGLIIGLILLFLFLGAVNTFLMKRIWGIQLKKNRMSVLDHGFALAAAFLLVSIPSFIIGLYAASLPMAIVLFIIYCFIDGYVAKTVGSYWVISPARRRIRIQLGTMGTLIVLLITAMAGTGFAVGLLVLVWLLLGGLLSGVLLFLTLFSGLVTLIGIIILSLSKDQATVDESN